MFDGYMVPCDLIVENAFNVYKEKWRISDLSENLGALDTVRRILHAPISRRRKTLC